MNATMETISGDQSEETHNQRNGRDGVFVKTFRFERCDCRSNEKSYVRTLRQNEMWERMCV